MKRLIILLASIVCVVSCVRNANVPEAPIAPRFHEVSIVISGGGLPAVETRSSVTAAEDGIRMADILFYSDGKMEESLTKHVSFSGGGVSSCHCSVQLQEGKNYELLVLANASAGSAPVRLQDALSGLVYRTSGISEWSRNGLPMAGRRRISITPTTTEVTVPLTRLVARVNFTVNMSHLKHGNIKFSSMAVRQMNTSCPFFSEGKASGTVCDGDLASASDIALVNSSGEDYATTFYLLENMQGSILAGNSDAEAKTPDNVRSAGHNPGDCTYLELKGTYTGSSGAVRSETLTARMFLGGDACSNFDIIRNRQYNIVLTITDDACLRTDWKIDGQLHDARVLSFGQRDVSLPPGESENAELLTNLSYADGDYSYAMSGDLMCFGVDVSSDCRSFAIKAYDWAPEGAVMQICAKTWDGKLESVHNVSVSGQAGGEYDISWYKGSGVLYLAQRGDLIIKDTRTGSYPSGKVTVQSLTGCADVIHPGGSTWYVDAVAAGEDELLIKIDGKEAARMSFMVAVPVLKFPSERIFLPLDGSMAACGPYYYREDGSMLNYSDFVPELYEELLDVSVIRKMESRMYGRSWRPGASGGNPVVRSSNIETDYTCFGFYVASLSSGGVTIGENYDMESGPVTLERLTAYPNDRDCGVEPAEAELYTTEPFNGSRHLGERSSWALARWYAQSSHDETFRFNIDNIVLHGNDCSSARGVYPFSSDNKYSFAYPDNNTIEVTILYSDNVETAMPEHDFAFAPAMRNRHSGELYVSNYRYTVDFTVNLAVAGVAEDNGAGACDVSARWAFPRLDDGRLRYLEENVLATVSDRGNVVKGMYDRLYTVHGYSPDYLMEMFEPVFEFADLTLAPSVVKTIETSSYHVPIEYGGGYDLILWKYGTLYPATGGWLSK